MSDCEVIVTRGPKGKQSTAYQRVLHAVLSEAELTGVWRMSSKKPMKASANGTFFVQDHDDNGFRVLIQPNGKDSGVLFDVIPPDDYDTKELCCDLKTWNGFKYTQQEDVITTEDLAKASRFREKETEWRRLEELKAKLEADAERCMLEAQEIEGTMAEITEAISRDVEGQKAWSIFKKALKL